ncbi:hypothetical protein DUI87_09226 [Hirundo rustica rustica]|uniref:Reverse transcriptase domain-containing protein n=1 Tax=Hirundo rustica rustica TaxID=333673 RepID=A0A3M0L4A5_HIRRU|nr:hypothetical protein DUI87_09226 [Hirundo rustica rustica]
MYLLAEELMPLYPFSKKCRQKKMALVYTYLFPRPKMVPALVVMETELRTRNWQLKLPHPLVTVSMSGLRRPIPECFEEENIEYRRFFACGFLWGFLTQQRRAQHSSALGLELVTHLVDVVYLDFSKACDTVSHGFLQVNRQLMAFGQVTFCWVKNWLDGWAQRVVVKGVTSSYQAVIRGVSHGSVLGSVLFYILTDDLHAGIKCSLCKFVDDTKLSGSVGLLEGRKALQRDLDRLNLSTKASNTRFSKDKYWDLHLGHNIPMQYYRLGAEGLESSPVENDLGVLVNSG